MENKPESGENPYRSPNAELSPPRKENRWRSLQWFLLASTLLPVLLLGLGIGASIARTYPPELLVAIPLMATLLNGPALMIVGIYQLSRANGAVTEGWLCVFLSLTYFFVLAIVTMA